MTGTVTIRYCSFRADIYLSALETLPLRNLKKLFKLAGQERSKNADAIEAIRCHLDRTIPEAQVTLTSATLDYENGWCKVDRPRSRNTATVEQLRKNRELTEAFKKARDRYKRLVNVRKVFNETLAPDTKHQMI